MKQIQKFNNILKESRIDKINFRKIKLVTSPKHFFHFVDEVWLEKLNVCHLEEMQNIALFSQHLFLILDLQVQNCFYKNILELKAPIQISFIPKNKLSSIMIKFEKVKIILKNKDLLINEIVLIIMNQMKKDMERVIVILQMKILVIF